MILCDDAGPLDFLDACVRDTWAALLPAGVVLTLLATSIPVPARLSRALGIVSTISQPSLTLSEAEVLEFPDYDSDNPNITAQDARLVTGWRQITLASIAVLQFLWSTAGAGWLLAFKDVSLVWRGVCALIIAFSWLYAAASLVVIRRDARTSFPYSLFILFLVFLVGAVLKLGGVVFDHVVCGFDYPSQGAMVMLVANVVSILVGVGVLLATPIGHPSPLVDPKDIGVTISSEDYVILWKWLTFSWMTPLMKLGKRVTLQQKDVWNLSPSMRARPVFVKFGTIIQSTLLRRLFVQNAQDLLFDALLTLATILFNYAGPFFLKRILDAIDGKNATKENRGKAYVFACLALVCTILKAQVELLHLWFGRRASARLRQALMAAIYDKALKRKDFSGVVKKDEEKAAASGGSKKSKAQAAADKKKKDSADDPKAGADIGKIVNLMSSDTNRLTFVIATLNNVYGAPFEIFIAVYFLYQLLGWSAFAGFSVTLIIWPVNTYLTRRRVRINKKHSNATDKRMGVLNELIAAIKLIKFYGWEERWIDKVNDARADELKMLVAARINSVFIGSIWTIAPVMVSVGSFYAYVMSGHDLTIGKAFTALALFNMVKDPVRGIPSTILQLTQASVALKRIEVYLTEDEVDGQVSSLKDLPTSSTSSEAVEGLGLEAATLTWNSVTEAVKSSHAKKQVTLEAEADSSSGHSQSDTSVGDKLFELQGISVMFPERKLSVVMGPTASGKTALLMALLGEMTLFEGRIIMSKDISRVDEYGLTSSISYAAQTPWLRHQSIRDNILFGSAYDEERYNDVLECCALNPDLNILEDGDATEIGARGINLSGGQKARVALARAVYARTKYVLLDDPLSAVDSHTARHLFDKLLTGPLLENRTVILVTHHVELVLPGTHYLVQMLDGRVHTQGSVEDLQTLGVLDGLVRRSADETKKLQQDILEEVAVEGRIDTSKPTGATAGAASEDGPAKGSKKPKKLVKDEHREVGGVKWKVYNSYLRASSYWTWAIIFTFTAILQFLTLGNKLWIRIWGDAYPSHASDSLSQYAILDRFPPSQAPLNHTTLVFSNWPDASVHPLYYVGIYAAIGFLTAVAINVVGITNFTGALRASRLLFGQLLQSVVRATFRFHDTTPQGRILNRFGQDIQTIDTGLAGSLQSVNSSMAGFFTSVITIIVVFPPLLVPALLIGYVYRELATAYLRTGRDIRRMMANSRSPIYSDFGELLEGVVTVRAFSAEQRFLSNLYMRLDVFTKFWYFFWMTNRWLLINYDMLGGFSIFVTSLFSIYKLNDDAGLAGLCITSAMSFTASIYWASRNWTALELDLNAVERVIEYLAIPQEQPAVIESNRVPAYWPSRTSSKPLVVLDDLEVKYAEDLPAVLQSISLELNAGERVGLLGRTGSGKSTLAMSILRFVDPSKGRVLIDGIDISTIGTHDLRSRLTFIPQDATLFSGTLRENLNPFGEYTDAECIDVLYRVGLIEPNVPSEPTSDSDTTDIVEAVVQGSSSKSVDTRSTHTQVERDSNKPIITLDTKIAAGGLNMSQGQRQLVAMARALLRNSSIIILDEATSSIDFATDSKIQKVIREGFTESLLLTIAHRLHTVIDYDRLIVLDKGKVVEFDTPWNLIHRDGGVFKDMCVKSGAFDELENLLRQNKQ